MWVASCCQEKLSLGKHVDISWANFVPHSVIVCWYLFVCVLDVLAFVHDAQKPTCSQALSRFTLWVQTRGGPGARRAWGPGGQGPPGGRGGVVGAEPQPGLGASRAGAPLERETGVSPGPRVLRYRERFIPNMQEDGFC